MSGRSDSLATRLARVGVVAAVPLAQSLAAQPWWHDGLIAPLAEVADPALALGTVLRIADVASEEMAKLSNDADAWRALLVVTGVSCAIGDFLVRRPEALVEFGAFAAAPSAQQPTALAAAASASASRAVRDARWRDWDIRGQLAELISPALGEPRRAADLLRRGYRGAVTRIAIADVADGSPYEQVVARLSDLADAVLGAALIIAHAELREGSPPCRLAIIGMGKCGGRELNYVSDVDVIFVAEPPKSTNGEQEPEGPALATATALATSVIRICGEATGEGSIWQVDANLRPEGRSGALVRTLRSHLSYYERWAKTWEFQALLKARPVAGDMELGRRYCDAVAPLVWSAAGRPGFVAEVQQMRQRVERNVPAKDADRQLKLGRGGLRDVEFSVQLLQLVHGRTDVMLRSPNTLTALESLAVWGYVGREDAAALARAYRFLRTLEHRIQIGKLRRAQIVPREAGELRRLGRSMGFTAEPGRELEDAWRRRGNEVRRIHEKLFYRPLLEAVARLDSGQARLTPEAAAQRLNALGFRDPEGALRHIEALTSGVSRRAAIQRTLLPVMLGWFADAPDPDAGLLGFRKVSEAMGSTPWYLRLLRDESAAAQRLAKVLASSRYASELLLRAPDGVAILGDPAELAPRTAAALKSEFAAVAARYPEAEQAVAVVRGLRRRELFRISALDVLGELTVDDLGPALTDVADATIQGALEAACDDVAGSYGGVLPTRMLIVGMGRFGGGEAGYGSDADVLFVHEPNPDADESDAAAAAGAVANEMRRLLNVASADPPLTLDADLRPEGKAGPLVRSLASYAGYYERWRSHWEAQALLRADRVAGDEGVWRRLCDVIDPIRWPEGGISSEQLREIRRLKARMESERLPRGADRTLHTKLGRGGLSDVEWSIQLIQLQHAHEVSELRTPRTLQALAAARRTGLLAPSDADILADAWRMATRIRNVVMLVRGRASDMVPTDSVELASVGRILGYLPGESGKLLDDYRRTTRRARVVAERLIYG